MTGLPGETPPVEAEMRTLTLPRVISGAHLKLISLGVERFEMVNLVIPEEPAILEFPEHPLEINADNYTLTSRGKVLEPQPVGFNIILFLALRADKVFRKEEIMEHVWKDRKKPKDGHAVSIHCSVLGQQILDVLGLASPIRNVRGRGLKFVRKPVVAQASNDNED